MESYRATSRKATARDLGGIAATFTLRRDEAERELVAAVAAHPPLVGRAIALGVTVERIDRDDLRLIYSAIVTGAEHELDRAKVGRLAKRALIDAGYWDDSEIEANYLSLWWSDAKLAALFDSWFPSAPIVERAARIVLELRARWIDATEAWAFARARLELPHRLYELDPGPAQPAEPAPAPEAPNLEAA